jgi:type IV pilus assembly protein PilQ
MKTNWPAIQCGCLLLATMALTPSPVLAQAREPASAPPGSASGAAVISSVAITQASQGASVRVAGEGRLDARAMRMRNPDRLVLDFTGARLAVRETVIPGVSAPVRGVRLGQFRPDVARVVIDLNAETTYEIARDGSAVVIFFSAVPPASVEKQVSITTTNTTAAQPATRRADFHFVPQAPRGALHRRSSPLPGVSTPEFELPRELTQPSFALASMGGKAAIPARPVQQISTNSGNAAAVVQQTAGGPPAGKYTGEPISVNLKEVDLRDFFRLIHEISGLNVVLDPAVKGTLTIVLDEVPWDQALDIVLQNNGLDKQLNGNVLRIATHDTLKKEAETQRDLQKAQAEAIDPVTVTRVLSYAKASALKDTLKRFLTSRGEILADERSNQLIIRDIPSVIPNVDNLIRQLDRKSQQVEIEARVVSASRSFAQDIGVQLGFAGQHATCSTCITAFGGNPTVGESPVSTGTGIAPPPLIGGGSTGGLPFNVNLGANAPTSGVFFGHRSPNFAIDFFISAAEAKGAGKLLSKPKVITQNNEKATVKQGTKIPIQTTINNTVSVQFIDAVLKLEVTPQITAEGTVFMDVLVENTQIDTGIPRVNNIPALNTQSAETKVLVADGGTVVIGGIIITQHRVDITQVPLVGSIPVIGHLFRRQNVSNSSQELLFFLTPRIIPG